MIIDCSMVTTIASTGLGVLTNLLKMVRAMGGNIILAEVQENIYDTFELLGFVQFFNIKSTVDAIPMLLDKKNADAYSKMGVLSKIEVESRYEILLEEYTKIINIEMLTALEMAKQEILPACIKYVNSLASGISKKNEIVVFSLSSTLHIQVTNVPGLFFFI